ncbi:helix-turn-helix domain-containing protein [Antrihabitans sp. NCIMB 15449]|uniref:Helix-turn-helix domain-containing protein n=1 Tax=Antrihabitans spumae TaxID=3373370 RepID=A0ABW7JMR3_9NOCA
MDNLNTIQQALEKVPVSRSKLYDLLKSHELKSVTVGRRRFILDSQIEEYIAGLTGDTDAA